MKSRNKIIVLFGALFLFIVAAAWGHLATRPQTASETIAVEYNSKTTQLDLAELPYQSVEGSQVNGKNETVSVSGQGAPLTDVLELAGVDCDSVTVLTVTAEDSYSASITGEELRNNSKIFLLQEEDTVRLIVFGDPNRKRNVSDVKWVTVE